MNLPNLFVVTAILSPLSCLASALPSPTSMSSEIVVGKPFNVAPCPSVGRSPLVVCSRQLHASTDSAGLVRTVHEAQFAAAVRPAWLRSFTVESADGMVTQVTLVAMGVAPPPAVSAVGRGTWKIGPVFIDVTLTLDGLPGWSERG